jgi:hypothetical protein
MKWLFLLTLSAAPLHADYAAWLGITPSFKYESTDQAPSKITVEWAPNVTWPESTQRHVRLPHVLPKESLDKLVDSFGKGPWSVYLEANDRKGFIVLARRMNEEAAGAEFPGEGEPRLPTPAERIEKAKELLAGIGYPVDTLVPRRRSLWVESEGRPGNETDTSAGVGLSATIAGIRLLPASAYSASAGFDRYGRTTEVRLVWRKTKIDGEFRLVTKEQAEAAILEGKARTRYFGFAQQLGAQATPEQTEIARTIAENARKRREAELPPPLIERRALITRAELVLIDYASDEGVYGDEEPAFGRFDDILWPMLLLKVELFTGEHSEKGELMIPADADWDLKAKGPAPLKTETAR